MEALQHIFSSADLTPHGFCLLWREDLLLLNAASDAAIGLSYYVIPVALTYFVLKRRDVAFGFLFWMFAAFILACGTTHLVEIWTIWHPAYGLQGAMKLVTAAVSVATAVAVWGLMPRALAFPSPSQYLEVRTALTSEIEQRQQVSEALAETEQRYELLIESVTDYAIISLDLHGVVTDWNKGAERIKGYRADEVIGRHFSMFYTPEDRDRGLPVKSLEEAEREGRYEAEGLRLRKDGAQFLANIVIQPIYDRRGAHIGFAKITRDITQRRELEERLRQSQKMEAIGQLTGGVAHDFNNHLTVVFASLDLAQRTMANRERLAQALDSATKGAERAAIVNGTAPRLRAAPAFEAGSDRCRPPADADLRPARPRARRADKDRDDPIGRVVAGLLRCPSAGGRAVEPCRQCARRDARRRQADARGGQCLSR